MNWRLGLIFTGRIVFALFCVLTSVYCLLAYIPFTYFHFLQFRHISSLTFFVEHHQFIYWVALAMVTATLSGDLHRERTRKLSFVFVTIHALVGVLLLVRPLLVNLQNDALSFVWSLVALEPLFWLAAIDFLGQQDGLTWAETDAKDDHRTFRAALLAALFVTLLYALISIVKQTAGAGAPGKLLAIAWSLAGHLLIFMAVFVALNLLRALARLFHQSARAEFWLCALFGAALLALALNHTTLSAISLTGGPANAYSLLASGGLMALIAGLALRLWQSKNEPVTSGLTLLLAPLTPGRLSSAVTRGAWIVLMVAVAYVGAVKLALFDWNFLMQKLSANLVWLSAFIFFYAAVPTVRSQRDRTLTLLLIAASSLGFYKTLEAAGTYQPRLDVSAALDSYAGQNISFKLTRELLVPTRNDEDFYRFLQQNTNIAHTVKVDPVEINLVQNLARADGMKPNIFIFTVDSLRSDYLSPYNPAVNFTPSISSFARESVVMENAFTHYGATGLSEPSIWVGGQMLHKQYVTPFYPMNTLQKLIEADGYQSFISLDTILRVVVKPSPTVVELDKDAPDKDFEFCRTLADLQTKLSARPPDAPSAFSYTQPQNIHVSVINREGKSVPPGESYPGFYAPYASRIRRMDICFGTFVDFLKARGMYEQSIIILTADHGDSLGEEGRWGHAYTIFPEIIRIPLIIHLPLQLQKEVVWNTKTVAFSTDVTPSLYYLLGHRPTLQNRLFGRPLFTATAEEQRSYLQESYLIASSYGAVYGMLRGNGRYLYIADGVNYTDYFYDLANDPEGKRNLFTPEIKLENEYLIKENIRAMGEFYRFNPQQ